MSALFHAHSGFRFLVLLLGAVNVVVLGVGFLQKKPFGKLHRVLGTIFAGSLHLQVLLGIALVAMGRYYPALVGHMVMMILAAVIAQAASSFNRRSARPSIGLALIGVVGALVCIAFGVMAIGRGLFTVSGA